MKVEFAHEHLARICTEEAYRLGLPINVIKLARRKLIQLHSATDERDLRNLKGLHYKKLQGPRYGQRSIRVNDQYRIIFTLSETQPATIRIIEIGDIH